jgi:predicted outer membrane repeat protein
MKSKFYSFITSAAFALALSVVFIGFSPDAYADHIDHSGWTALTSRTATLTDGSYYLSSDINGDLTINGNVQLCLNGHNITGSGSGSVISVVRGASLQLEDCCTGGVITGGNATEGGGIFVDENASLTMTGGTVTGNKANRGGGVFAAASSELSISDSNITENTGKTGGGVFLRCDAQISGCDISENYVEYKGGGVYAESTGAITLDIEDCKINSNTADSHGGGIYVENCQLNMAGSEVSSNQATAVHASGGGIYLGDYSAFTMGEEVTISDNTASNEGGGICVSGSTYSADLNMLGGTVSGNSAKLGGGISTTGSGDFVVSGGKISGNSASENGGGIYISYSYTRDVEKSIANCDISGNTAASYGGGIFIEGDSFISVILSGDSIRRNTAMDGGGVYVDSLKDLSLSGQLFLNGNTISGRGPNLYLHSAQAMSVSGLESGSMIGLGMEYTDKSVFTTDAKSNCEALKNYFTSDVDGFGISIADSNELQIALSCQVDFNTNGGYLAETSRSYTTGDMLGELPVPQKDGYTFTYWDNNGRKVSETDIVSLDKTLNANYEFNKYTVSFDANGGSGTMDDQNCRYTVPFTISKCSFTSPSSNLIFIGWSLTPDGEVQYTDQSRAGSLCKTANGNVTLYAQWGVPKADAISIDSELSLSMGETKTLTVTAEPAGTDVSDVVWSSSNEKYATVDENGTVTAIAAGKATITATTGNGATASCQLEVGRRTPTASDFTFSARRSFPYDGNAHAPELESYPEGMKPTVTYIRLSDNKVYKSAPSDIGSYSVNISVAQSTGYAATSDITDSAWCFIIEPGVQRDLSIVNIPDSICYGQAFTLGTEGGSGDGAVTWSLTQGDSAVVNEETGDIYVCGNGSFTVTATKAGDSQFEPSSASVTLSVSKQKLYMEAVPAVATEKQYDGTDYAEVWDYGTIGGLSEADQGSVSLSITARYEDVNAGTDKVIIISYALNSESEYYEAPDDSYVYGAVIDPMPVSLTWNYTNPYTYNGGEQQVSAQVTNALNGDTVSCVSYDGAAGVNAGDYYAAVTALDNSNYTLEDSYNNGLYWSIQPYTVTVTANDLHKNYSEADPELSYTVADDIPVLLTGELSRDYGEDVGSYYIRQGTLALADELTDNYVIKFVEGLLTVDEATNYIGGIECADIPYGGTPEPYAEAAFGYASYSYSQSPDGPFTDWDEDNAPGVWYVKASVEGTVNYSSTEYVLPFTVNKEELAYFVQLDTIDVSAQGSVLNNIASVLPMNLSFVNNRYLVSQYQAQVWWDIEECDYNPDITGAQLVTVTGTAFLPQEVNNSNNVSCDISVQIYVNPYTAASTTASGSSSGTDVDPFL